VVLVSADNRAKCPRCAKRTEAALLKRELAVAESYGTVSIEDFDRARADLADERSAAQGALPTFREDYEIYGAEDGIVHVDYSGSCQECGLSLSFTHEHPLGVDGVA